MIGCLCGWVGNTNEEWEQHFREECANPADNFIRWEE